MTEPLHSFCRPQVLVSWDGRSTPWQWMHLDAQPEFDWLLFDYSGRTTSGQTVLRGQDVHLISQATECKGEIYSALARHLIQKGQQPEFVALIDDDVMLSVSGINRLLHMGRCLWLDAFSPALSHDSHFSHRWLLSQNGHACRKVPWIEVMMPFYRGDLFLAGAPHYEGNVSSWGIDQYLIPTLQQLRGQTATAVIDAVVASHCRPITSGGKTYRNGLTAVQEKQRMKERCVALLQDRPDLLSSDWFRRTLVSRHARSRWQRISHGLRRRLRQWLDEAA